MSTSAITPHDELWNKFGRALGSRDSAEVFWSDVGGVVVVPVAAGIYLLAEISRRSWYGSIGAALKTIAQELRTLWNLS